MMSAVASMQRVLGVEDGVVHLWGKGKTEEGVRLLSKEE